jgi:alpha-glucosidase (family GH31 glycosyl hydrolase)
MQWHSEPSYGQFADIVKGDGRINDRSPWNMADVCKDDSIIEIATFYANLHMNLVPYIYQEALKSIKERSSLMKHLYLEYNEDEKAAFVNDEYMIGDLLIAPLLEEGKSSRKIYLPKGKWLDLWTGNEIEGASTIAVEAAIEKIPVFVRINSVIFLNITEEGLGSYVGNSLEDMHNLTAIVVGGSAKGVYIKSDGNRFCMEDGLIKENTLEIKVITLKELVEMKRIK